MTQRKYPIKNTHVGRTAYYEGYVIGLVGSSFVLYRTSLGLLCPGQLSEYKHEV